MRAMLQVLTGITENSYLLTVFFDTALKSVLVLALAGVAAVAWRRGAAAGRHLLWFLALLSLPMLPLLSTTSPGWHRPLWSASANLVSGNQVEFALAAAGRSSAPGLEGAGASVPRPALNAPPSSAAVATRVNVRWLGLALLLWFAVALCLLLFQAARQIQLWSLRRRAQPLSGADWRALLDELRHKLRIRRPVLLLCSADNLIPLTWRWWRPLILLPAEAQHWAPERRRIVLLHELAHIKRWDSLTQFVAGVICALFWFNPLAWLAARRLCVERERACDDLVLNGGCRASDYAEQLLDIARSFRHTHGAPAIAMARATGLHGRINAIVDGTRARRLHPLSAVVLVALGFALVGSLSGKNAGAATDPAQTIALRQQQVAHLQAFSLAKEKQSEALAAKAGQTIAPDFRRFFQAATQGDGQTVTNLYEFYKRHHGQYASGTNVIDSLRTPYWSPVLEICLAYDHVLRCDPRYTKIFVDGVNQSVPPGSIYFGGTDPGRGLPTAFEKSSIDGDPYFVLTQNALADGTYLDYLRAMYGGKIYTPTTDDSQKSFNEYLADATRRLKENKLKPGEDVHRTIGGKVEVTGQIAVMSINALLTKLIFDRNPDREFYIEESFPLDWMYPHLEPHGVIMKLNRQPLERLPDDVLARDHEYWAKLVAQMVGGEVKSQGTVSELTAFVDRVYVRNDLKGFTGDPLYIRNDYAKRLFSKLRATIGGLYAWRLSPNASVESQPQTDADRQRLIRETDFAFRQACAICPESPEAVFRYVNFLLQFSRTADAKQLARTALAVDPENRQFQGLLSTLEQMGKK